MCLELQPQQERFAIYTLNLYPQSIPSIYIDLGCSKKTLVSFKKCVHSQLLIFDLLSPCSSLFILHAGCLWTFEWKFGESKERKELFVTKLNIKDDNVYNNNKNIYVFIYKKKKLTTKQLTKRNSIGYLINQTILSTESACLSSTLFTDLPPPAFPLHNKPFIKKGLLEEMEEFNHNVSAFMHLNIKTNKQWQKHYFWNDAESFTSER